MKLLVFAHTPPPHHGQSYMVQLMLEGLGGNKRRRSRGGGGKSKHNGAGDGLGIECYHVNARVSDKLEDIGEFQPWKVMRLVWFCFEAILCRFRYGIENFYYVPAPGKRAPVYRDWMVMFLCRPFFKRTILHWHASGLAKWLEFVVRPRWRAMTYRLAGQVDLSIVLSAYGRADAEKLYPRRVAIVGNGIPDPCPEFSAEVLALRRARFEARRLLLAGRPLPESVVSAAGPYPQVFTVLFLAHCTADKGLFEAVQGAILAQKQLAARCPAVSLRLVVAGQFVQGAEEAEFQHLCRGEGGQIVSYLGYVSGDSKRRLFCEADVFCFPSYIESFGLVLVEAMAFGLPAVTTRCGALPEVMSAEYPGLIPPRSAEAVGDALLRMMDYGQFEWLRRRFEENFILQQHLSRLAVALHSVEQPEPRQAANLALSDPAMPR